MKANELRIGNLLRYDKTQDYCFIELIHNNHFDCRSIVGNIFTPNAKYEPIPLTEEWLLKFGFKRFPWGLVKGNLLFKDDLKCSYLILQVGNGFDTKIRYVHQLQNIYFALTGEELTIKN